MAPDSEPPTPLGWCSDCLHAGQRQQAVSLFSGFGVCENCNNRRSRILDKAAEQFRRD